MLTPIRTSRRSRRIKYKPSVTIVPLQLVSVSYDVATSVTLVFNQPINVGAIDLYKFFVNDANEGVIYQGYELAQDTPESFRLGLSPYNPSPETRVWLQVLPGNGVQSTNGQEWAGVNEWVIG